LEDPEIKAFLEAFELEGGWLGGDLWSRSGNHSFIVTREQRLEARKRLMPEDEEDDWWGNPPNINPDNDDVIVIYGDDYQTTANTLAHMLRDVCDRLNLRYDSHEMH